MKRRVLGELPDSQFGFALASHFRSPEARDGGQKFPAGAIETIRLGVWEG